MHLVHGEGGWLAFTGGACVAYSRQLHISLGHHHLLSCNLLLNRSQDFQTLTLTSLPPFPSHCCLSLFCPVSCHFLVHPTFLTPCLLQSTLKGLSPAHPWGTSRRVTKATSKVVFLLSAPMSGLWQMGAAVTGEILLISCNLSPLHAQSHCGACAFPAACGQMD